MHTEDEARTKWCPMARFTIISDGSTESNRGNGTSTRCIASDCVAWRWGTKQVILDLKTRVMRDDVPGSSYSPDSEVLQDIFSGKGFCGLAGKDEA